MTAASIVTTPPWREGPLRKVRLPGSEWRRWCPEATVPPPRDPTRMVALPKRPPHPPIVGAEREWMMETDSYGPQSCGNSWRVRSFSCP